ncbi:hypothetical protein DL96DRAFT_1585563 [Flagelloscypha sp. PMI_526]|nr:hypothetical protein DL96DRAFT_1585563 [Flagelloscypha sp. PMI_526]
MVFPLFGSEYPTPIAIYNILQILGFLANSSIALTAYFSRRVHRSSNWYMAILLWAWWNIPYLLLMFTGYQLSRKDVPVPPRALCTIQAALIYATPSSAGFATFGILGQIASLLFEILYEKPGLSQKVSRSLLCIPVIGYVAIFFISLSVGIDNSSEVKRSATGAYCNMSHPLPSVVSAIACLASVVLILLLELFTFALLWKHRAWVKRMKTGSRPIPISLFIRVACFSSGPIAGTIFSISSIGSKTTNGPYQKPTIMVLTAGFPLLAAVALGTQRDILRVWMFWKRPSYMSDQPNKEVVVSA